MTERLTECENEFKRIWGRLSNGDTNFDKMKSVNHEHELRIKILEMSVTNLIKSISGLTKALWAIVTTVAMIGAGFIIWYIQNMGGLK